MVLTFTLLFTALGYLVYKSKDEVILIDEEDLNTKNSKIKDDDDLFDELEDLFI